MLPFEVPIVFIVFNRPDVTARVFDEIRRIKPVKLLVVADGPRVDHQEEAEKCAIVRSIVESVDWPCEVLRNYSDFNMGCRKRVSSGLGWAFDQVEEAIILEDDCLPDKSFFHFCEQLLTYYRNDERMMHIGGANFQFGTIRGDGSYYFSHLNHVWGWATWKRAWKFYDVAMTSYPHFSEHHNLNHVLPDKEMQRAWLKSFKQVYDNQLDTWDYQWTYAIWQQNGLSITPNANLVSNIGFGCAATHTIDSDNPFAGVSLESIVDLVHPLFVVPNIDADKFSFRVSKRSRLSRYCHMIRRQIARYTMFERSGCESEYS